MYCNYHSGKRPRPLRHCLCNATLPLLSLCDIFPRPGEVFPQRERLWQYGKVSRFAKGQLEPGYDADFVLVDLDTPYTVDKDKLHSKSHNTPFDGVELYGKVCATIKGGKITYQAEE